MNTLKCCAVSVPWQSHFLLQIFHCLAALPPHGVGSFPDRACALSFLPMKGTWALKIPDLSAFHSSNKLSNQITAYFFLRRKEVYWLMWAWIIPFSQSYLLPLFNFSEMTNCFKSCIPRAKQTNKQTNSPPVLHSPKLKPAQIRTKYILPSVIVSFLFHQTLCLKQIRFSLHKQLWSYLFLDRSELTFILSQDQRHR